MTEHAKKLLLLYYKQSREIRRVSGLPPLTFKAKKAETLNNYHIYGNTETKTQSYSGSAPLSFPIEDGSVSNYLIYGNTVNGESVGDLVESGEHAGEYSVPVTVTNGTDTETTNLYLPEQISKVGDEAEYLDYGEQKMHRVRKNLLQNIATSQTIRGVTFTVNSDGSIVCDGQASPSTAVLVYSNFLVPSGTYILTGCPNGGSERETYKMLLFINGEWLANDTGSGANFTLTETSTVSARIDIYNGYTCDNLTFYPMLRLASIADDTYEPYIENTEVDVTLPALPTLPGTNTLTVGTEVQPSSVAVEVNEVVSCGDRIENLFDGSFIHRSVIIEEVGDDNPNRRSIVVDISNFNNGDKITFSRETSAGNLFQMYQVSSPLKGGRLLNSNVISGDSKTLLATITLDDISNYHYLMIFLNGATNIITDEELLASKIIVNVGNTPLPYEAYGYKVPVTVNGKNLINSSIYEIRNTGVEYTVNNDKSITANGSTSSNFSLFLVKVYLTKGSYIISGCPQNGSQNTYRCEIRDMVLTSLAQDTGAGVTYSIVTDGYYYYSIRIAQNYVCNNLTFYPMIRKADIEDDTYEPYHAPVTTPIYLPEPIKMVGDEAEYIDYAEQKQHRVRKNLLPNTATSQTINGITFTVNEDGSVTCNGTATNITEAGVFLDFLLPPGKYRLTGCPPGGWSSYPGGKVSYCLRAWYAISGNITWLFDYGDGCNFTLTDTKKMRSSIVIEKAQVVDNITFYPMIRKVDIEDDTYEPYIENTEVDVILPALPVLPGANTLTVGTEVQPSSVEIKGRIKAAGGD